MCGRACACASARVHACTCVCSCVCACVSAYGRMCINKCPHVRVHGRRRVFVRAFTCACVYLRVMGERIRIHRRVRTHTHTLARLRACTSTRAGVHTQARLHALVRESAYAHAYMHTRCARVCTRAMGCAHTCTNTHMHQYTCVRAYAHTRAGACVWIRASARMCATRAGRYKWRSSPC